MTQETSFLCADAKLPYCRGCGHGHILRRLDAALTSLSPPEGSVVLTTDIGCVGLADALFPTLHTVHTTHGRSTAFAAGMALADAVDPKGMKPVVLIGDGGATIGLLHLVHAAQINVDVTVLVHNNFLFGMTGGQHSGLTPEGLVTSTTPEGNPTPPLDLTSLIRAAGAGFLARTEATDPRLEAILAEAIAYPGFALVEILDLCTAHASRYTSLTGRTIRRWAREGQAPDRVAPAAPSRPDFAAAWRERSPARRAMPGHGPVRRAGTSGIDGPVRIVVAGSAGGRVQSAAGIFCRAALACGLYSTQKNDNPVTQGTGFSLAEITIAAGPIDYTGMEVPDAVLVVSTDGTREITANGLISRCGPRTSIWHDAGVPAPAASHAAWRAVPFVRETSDRDAALAALAAWARQGVRIPPEAWDAAIEQLPAGRREEASAAIRAGERLARHAGS